MFKLNYVINPKQYIWNSMSFLILFFYDIYKSSKLFLKDFYTIFELTVFTLLYVFYYFPAIFFVNHDFKIKYCFTGIRYCLGFIFFSSNAPERNPWVFQISIFPPSGRDRDSIRFSAYRLISWKMFASALIESDFNTFTIRRDWFDDFNVPKESSLSVNSAHVHLYSAESLRDLNND